MRKRYSQKTRLVTVIHGDGFEVIYRSYSGILCLYPKPPTAAASSLYRHGTTHGATRRRNYRYDRRPIDTKSTPTESPSPSPDSWELRLKDLLWDLPSEHNKLNEIEIHYDEKSPLYPDVLLDILYTFIHDFIPAYWKECASTNVKISLVLRSNPDYYYKSDDDGGDNGDFVEPIDYASILKANHRLLEVVSLLPSRLIISVSVNHSSGVISPFFDHAMMVVSTCVQLNPYCLEGLLMVMSASGYVPEHRRRWLLSPESEQQRQEQTLVTTNRILGEYFSPAMKQATALKSFQLKASLLQPEQHNLMTALVTQAVANNSSLESLEVRELIWNTRDEFDTFLQAILDHPRITELDFERTGYYDEPTGSESLQQLRQSSQEGYCRLLPALCDFLSCRRCKISSLAVKGPPYAKLKTEDLDWILSCLWNGHPMRRIDVRCASIKDLHFPRFQSALNNGSATTQLEMIDFTNCEFSRYWCSYTPCDRREYVEFLSQSLLFLLEKLPNFSPEFCHVGEYYISESHDWSRLEYLLDRNRINQRVGHLRAQHGRTDEEVKGIPDTLWCYMLGKINHRDRSTAHQADNIYRTLNDGGAFVPLITNHRHYKEEIEKQRMMENLSFRRGQGTTKPCRIVCLVGDQKKQKIANDDNGNDNRFQDQQRQTPPKFCPLNEGNDIETKTLMKGPSVMQSNTTATSAIVPIFEVVYIYCAKRRFEILCYKSKLRQYRKRQTRVVVSRREHNGTGDDGDTSWREIKNVLASYRVHLHVEQRIYVPEELLKKTFGTTNELQIATMILQRGVSKPEKVESKLVDIATWLSNNCIRDTGRTTPSFLTTDAGVQATMKHMQNSDEDQFGKADKYRFETIRNAMNHVNQVEVHLSKPVSAQCDRWIEALKPLLPMSRRTNKMKYVMYPLRPEGQEEGPFLEVKCSLMEAFMDEYDVTWKKCQLCGTDGLKNTKSSPNIPGTTSNYYRLELNQRQHKVMERQVRKEWDDWAFFAQGT